jgi:hypothetical protein
VPFNAIFHFPVAAQRSWSKNPETRLKVQFCGLCMGCAF